MELVALFCPVYYPDRGIILLEQCDKPSLFQVGQHAGPLPPIPVWKLLVPASADCSVLPTTCTTNLLSVHPRLHAIPRLMPPPLPHPPPPTPTHARTQAVSFASQRFTPVGTFFNVVTQSSVNG